MKRLGFVRKKKKTKQNKQTNFIFATRRTPHIWTTLVHLISVLTRDKSELIIPDSTFIVFFLRIIEMINA